jgi:hypothetical protein
LGTLPISLAEQRDIARNTIAGNCLVAITEAGNDVLNVKTKARRDGDDWVIDGLTTLDASQACVKSPGFNPRALTATSGSGPQASTRSFGAIIAPTIAVAFAGSCSAT